MDMELTPIPASDGQPSIETVLKFALAVARPGSAGHLLRCDEEGHKQITGVTSVESAVRSGRAFMVTPSVNTLAIDADTSEQVDALTGLAEQIREAGFTPVVLASGRGHHLFARMAPAWVARFAKIAKTLNLDVRLRTPIRPPLSPHPAGLPVHLVSMTVEEALVALTSQPAHTGKLSKRMAALLRDGQGIDLYPSRSEAVQAIATAAVNARWTKQQFIASMTDQRNALARAVADRQRLTDWLGLSWSAAVKFVEGNPLPDSAAAIEEIANEIDRHSDQLPLRPQGRAVLAAHVMAAWQCGSPTHVLPTGDAAVLAGATKPTVRKWRKRLMETGILVLVEKGGGGRKAHVWRLISPTSIREICPSTNSHPPESSCENRGEHSARLNRTYCTKHDTTRRTIDVGHDAFRWGALGKWAPHVIQVMREANGGPLTIAEIVRRLPPPRPQGRTISNLLHRCRDAGIAYRLPGRSGWILYNDDELGLRTVAEQRNCAGKRDAQIAANEAEREMRQAERWEWKKRLTERNDPSRWEPDPMLTEDGHYINPTTGEIVEMEGPDE